MYIHTYIYFYSFQRWLPPRFLQTCGCVRTLARSASLVTPGWPRVRAPKLAGTLLTVKLTICCECVRKSRYSCGCTAKLMQCQGAVVTAP